MGKPKHEIRYTIEPENCGHCGNLGAMKIVAQYEDIQPDKIEEYSVLAGPCCLVFQCPVCKKFQLQTYQYCDVFDGEYFDHEIVYPPPPKIPLGLPKKIANEYLTALKAKNGPPNAYGVLMTRAIELVCDDRKAKGKMLGEKINNLATRNEIPKAIADVARRLAWLRNKGAHASLGKLTKKEVPIIENLTRAILEYVYSAPYLVKQAEKALGTSQQTKSKTVSPPEKERTIIPIRTRIVKKVPMGIYFPISINTPDYENKFLKMISGQHLIMYGVYDMPTLSPDVREALFKNKYVKYVTEENRDMRYLAPSSYSPPAGLE